MRGTRTLESTATAHSTAVFEARKTPPMGVVG